MGRCLLLARCLFPLLFDPEDGDSMELRNVGRLQLYTASATRYFLLLLSVYELFCTVPSLYTDSIQHSPSLEAGSRSTTQLISSTEGTQMSITVFTRPRDGSYPKSVESNPHTLPSSFDIRFDVLQDLLGLSYQTLYSFSLSHACYTSITTNSSWC
jgi:hypothetical protein